MSQIIEPSLKPVAYIEHWVKRDQYQLYARDYAGVEPAIVLLHGFPDNSHLYDLLVPFLSPARRVITFDFLGWGASDKPTGYPYTHHNMRADLDTIIQYFELSQVVLVAHDASGPAAIDWALNNPVRVANLILLNTYYNSMPGLRLPEVIFLVSTPIIRNLARILFDRPRLHIFERIFYWQVGKRFIRDKVNQERFVPLFMQQFLAQPSAGGAFMRLAEDLQPTLKTGNSRTIEAHNFPGPVRIIFGQADPYLNQKAAQGFQQLFPSADLFLLPTVKHFPQLDEPQTVAYLILQPPLAK